VIVFENRPLWVAEARLWSVTVTQGIQDEVVAAQWDVTGQEDGSTAVTIQTNTLPLNTELHVWVRTPTGDVLFASYVLYPH
jgi:hypothetical protein